MKNTRKKAPTITDYCGNVVKYTTKKEFEKKKKRIDKRLLKERIETWKLKVIERDKSICQKCGNFLPDRKHCHPHHILALQSVKRNYPELIDDINNGVLTCYFCHKIGPCSAHQGGFEFTFWLMQNKPEQYFYLLNYLNSKKEVKHGNNNC